jgi:hypothetical protein
MSRFDRMYNMTRQIQILVSAISDLMFMQYHSCLVYYPVKILLLSLFEIVTNYSARGCTSYK